MALIPEVVHNTLPLHVPLPVFTDFQRVTVPLEEVAPFRNSSNA